MSAFDPARTTTLLVNFLGNYARSAGVEGAVVGLSGGVDSAVVAALASRALGADRVLGLVLPHRDSDPRDAEHAGLVANATGIEAREVDITPVTDAVTDAVAAPVELTEAAAGNVKARVRMVLLYAHANSMDRLVLGTGNKSELLVGYFTKYGDGGADVYPIGDVYKTDVFTLARHLGVPDVVVDKPPSAGLREGQRDEDDLGLPYDRLDPILQAFEAGLQVEEAARRTGEDAGEVQRVASLVHGSEHKRTSLVVPKVGFRTPGLDWRLPRAR